MWDFVILSVLDSEQKLENGLTVPPPYKYGTFELRNDFVMSGNPLQPRSFFLFVFHFFSDYCVLPIRIKCKTSFGIKTDACQNPHIATGTPISILSQPMSLYLVWFLSVLGGNHTKKNVQSEFMSNQIWCYLIFGGYIIGSKKIFGPNLCQAKSAVISFWVSSPEKKFWV